MLYTVNKSDGYISGVAAGSRASGEVISREAYNAIRAAILARPVPPDGYGCRLREDLEWELYELPPGPGREEETTEADYRAALLELGVSL